MDNGHKRIDVIIMDFANTLDKVPHRRLLFKLDFYGISLNIFYSINAQYIYIIQTLYIYKGLERKHIMLIRVLFLVKVSMYCLWRYYI